MKCRSTSLLLTLSLLAAPALAVDAVPFAGFSGLLLGNPGAPTADVPARFHIGLLALAEYGGAAEVGVVCELEQPEGLRAAQALSGAFRVRVTLIRQDGSREKVTRLRMRLRDGEGEVAKLREMSVFPGDYLLFEFKRRGAIELGPDERLLIYGYAGAPDVR